MFSAPTTIPISTPNPTPTAPLRPTTTSSPVLIPLPARGQRDASHGRARPNRRPQADAISPSVAALLALTSIPHPKTSSLRPRGGATQRQRQRQRLTVDAILEQTASAEKPLGLALGEERSPLELLLSAPDDDDTDTDVVSMSMSMSASTRSISSESIPSLDGCSLSLSDASPPFTPVKTPASLRSRRPMPCRRTHSLSPSLLTPPEDHPLSETETSVEELDFQVSPQTPEHKQEKHHAEIHWRKPAFFKSNLTASLRALRSAARSLSSLATPLSISPDDFTTRSIGSIDPQVPFTDERVPPRLEDAPTPALRRYLNPTTNAPIEAHVPKSRTQTISSTTCTASIQMQTYRVSCVEKGASTPEVISPRTQATEVAEVEVAAGPLARQRDLRENSDFIRVAVMEMLMRKNGKIDDQKPGRARWALPPRKPPTKPYEISDDGIPVRWIALTN
ncbi:uncharacterized protein L3040_001173 [Drepanopeziza brunnea f. sp. 'multigermtubi']|uniref:uncharacterized protein n=1 Tax=Drepanopeziza brunnea f. sp. 'multigermtubi' TaxID=698441 RepID=UPI002388C6DF|nr:hypothetical protein L3040_001173 [Drepanopeziza brunnea f. sp. 'multigermtubi']